MQENNAGRFEKSFNYLAWYWSAASVLDVFHENGRKFRDGHCKIKPSADVWCINDRLRQDVHERACRAWCRLTKLDDTYFPLSVDGTSRLYFRIRKRRRDEIEAFDREIDDAIGKDPSSGQTLFDGIEDEN